MTALPCTAAPECSRPLVLRECLERWRREARHGTLDTGRYRCRIFAWGEGPPLVCIPGLASEGRAFVPLLARLSGHFCGISYDLPVGGADGARLTTYRHDDYVADLFALLDHLHLERCHLLGQSFGSTVALAAALRQPQRFERLILLGGFARRPLAPAEVFVGHWARYLPGLLAQVPLLGPLMRRVHHGPFRPRPDEDWRFYLDCVGRTPLKVFAQRALVMHGLDLRARLPAVPHRVLLVCGDHDPLVARSLQQELRDGLRFAAQAEIEECGHHAHLSHPEVMAEAVRLFLAAG